jgi:hypothetical protein
MVGGKLLVGFTIPCSFFEFTLLNHCAYQSANSHIERTHFGKCFFCGDINEDKEIPSEDAIIRF